MLERDLATMRRQYADVGLDAGDVDADPIVQLRRWLGDAVTAGLAEPNAMVLSTVDPAGTPASRVVLLKAVVDGELVFFTNRSSRKGAHLAANPACALLFCWIAIGRQLAVRGVARPLDDAASDVYFASRPRGSQLSAWASPQSEVVADRAELERRHEAARRRFPHEVPRPPSWGGYQVTAHEVELWQGRPNRLHDRLRYRKDGGRWLLERLAP